MAAQTRDARHHVAGAPPGTGFMPQWIGSCWIGGKSECASLHGPLQPAVYLVRPACQSAPVVDAELFSARKQHGNREFFHALISSENAKVSQVWLVLFGRDGISCWRRPSPPVTHPAR